MNLKDKALVVIEHISLNSVWLDLEGYEKNMGLIYQASHVANGECTAGHEDWIEWVETVYTLVERGEYKEIDV